MLTIDNRGRAGSMNETVKKEGLVIFYFIIAWRLFLLIEVVIFGIRAEDGNYTILFTFIGYIGYLLSRFAIWAIRIVRGNRGRARKC